MKLSDYIKFEMFTIDGTFITKGTFKDSDEIIAVAEARANVKNYLKEPQEFKRRMKRDVIKFLFSALADRVIEEMELDE